MAKTSDKMKVPCTYQNVSINDQAATIGIKLSRSDVNLAKADWMLCNTQIATKLRFDPGSDEDAVGQETMVDIEVELSANFSSKGFRVTSRAIAARFIVPRDVCEISELARFANQSGTLSCKRLGSDKEEEQEEDMEENDAIE